MARMTPTPSDSLIGYIVIGDGWRTRTRMVPTLAAAHRLAHRWDRQVARYYGGGYDPLIAAVRCAADGQCYVTAGGGQSGEPGTGLAGLGVAGSAAVARANQWLQTRPSRWRRSHGIVRRSQ